MTREELERWAAVELDPWRHALVGAVRVALLLACLTLPVGVFEWWRVEPHDRMPCWALFFWVPGSLLLIFPLSLIAVFAIYQHGRANYALTMDALRQRGRVCARCGVVAFYEGSERIFPKGPAGPLRPRMVPAVVGDSCEMVCEACVSVPGGLAPARPGAAAAARGR